MLLASVCSSTRREWQRSVRTVLRYIQHTFCGRSLFSSMFCWETFKFLFIRIQQTLLDTLGLKRRIFREQCIFRFRQNVSYLPAIISVRHPACQSGNVTSHGRHSLRSDLYPPCLETVCHWILCLWQCVCMCRGRGATTNNRTWAEKEQGDWVLYQNQQWQMCRQRESLIGNDLVCCFFSCKSLFVSVPLIV